MVNLVMGVFWFLIAFGLLFYEPFTGRQGYSLKIGNSNINAGWLAMGLALWNAARTWSAYSYQQTQICTRNALLQREQTRKAEEQAKALENPLQDFNDKPLQ